METKLCLQCGSQMKGRVDKKFCDDQCRTVFNNHLKTDTPLIRNINHALRKNRKILEELVPISERKLTVTRRRLEERGFSFSFHTHTLLTETGSMYLFCYEYGILPIDNDHFLLVKDEEEYD